MNSEINQIREKALSAYSKHKYQDAISGFESCLKYYESVGDLTSAAEMRNNLAVVLMRLRKPEESLHILENTNVIFSAAGDKKREAMAISNMATALENLNQKERALEHYEQSLEILKTINEPDLKQDVLRRISDLQLKTGRNFQAIATIDSALGTDEKPKFINRIFQRLMQFIRIKFLKF